MKSAAVLILALLLLLPAPALAQTEGCISVGGSVGRVFPSDSDLEPVTTFGFLVRLNPRRGWGPAAAFGWFRADLEDPDGSGQEFARLRVRPLMGGIAYTVGRDKVLTSFSVVAGPSFNSIDFEDSFIERHALVGAPSVDIETSFAVRPGVNVTITVAPRVAIIAFAGYSFNRPDVVYRAPDGTEFRNRWKADAASVSIAAVYSLF